jgi:hypothetical protein
VIADGAQVKAKLIKQFRRGPDPIPQGIDQPQGRTDVTRLQRRHFDDKPHTTVSTGPNLIRIDFLHSIISRD